MVVEQREAAFEAMSAASRFGLIDVVWLDYCPLFTPLHGDPVFQTIRNDIAARASRVLASFRAAGG